MSGEDWAAREARELAAQFCVLEHDAASIFCQGCLEVAEALDAFAQAAHQRGQAAMRERAAWVAQEYDPLFIGPTEDSLDLFSRGVVVLAKHTIAEKILALALEGA